MKRCLVVVLALALTLSAEGCEDTAPVLHRTAGQKCEASQKNAQAIDSRGRTLVCRYSERWGGLRWLISPD